MNNEFLRQYKRISKSCQGDFTGIEGELKDVFIRLLGDFPEEMAAEGAEYFLKGQSLDEEVQKAADFLDLHNEELEGAQSVLGDGDWIFLKDLVNAYAEELDMDWVAYFMQFLLDRQLL